MDIYGKVILLVVLIGISGFFSASETALTAFKGTDLEKTGNERIRELLKKWMKNPDEMLTGILFGNNIVNISASSIGTAVTFAIMGNNTKAIVMSTFFMTLVILIFGEITPKIIAKNSSSKVSKGVILPIYFISVIASPVVKVLIFTSKVIGRLFGIEIGRDSIMITQQDIISYINVGEVEGIIEKDEKTMIHSIFELGETQAKEVMTQRTDMFTVYRDQSIDEVWEDIRRNGYSRIPVCGEDGIDDIVGILYLKDVLNIIKSGRMDIPVGQCLREAYFVPETKPVMEVFREFKSRKVHLAVVIDEYGGTAGVLTIEDLIEEIVGDIQDEHDREEDEYIRNLDEGVYEVNTNLTLDALDRNLGIGIPRSERYKSLSGYMTENLGKSAEIGDILKVPGADIRVLELDRIRVSKVMISKEKQG